MNVTKQNSQTLTVLHQRKKPCYATKSIYFLAKNMVTNVILVNIYTIPFYKTLFYLTFVQAKMLFQRHALPYTQTYLDALPTMQNYDRSPF